MTVRAPERPEPICGMDSWLPVPVRIEDVVQENFNTRTFRLTIIDPVLAGLYRCTPGQFNMLWVPGVGEAAISVSSDAEERGTISHTVRVVGSVTRAMHGLGQGGVMGLRGPFGRGWPVARLAGRELVLVAGGIGLAPLRPMIYWVLNHRADYGRVILLYGARTPEDRLFVPELERWAEEGCIDVLVTVDNGTAGWVGPVGVVTKLIPRVRVNGRRTTALICGPRMLNRVSTTTLLQLGVAPQDIYVSLERNMNCGFGRCGHCQYGETFVCRDGPVFSYAQIAHNFGKEEI